MFDVCVNKSRVACIPDAMKKLVEVAAGEKSLNAAGLKELKKEPSSNPQANLIESLMGRESCLEVKGDVKLKPTWWLKDGKAERRITKTFDQRTPDRPYTR